MIRLDDGTESALRIVGSYMPAPGDTVRITRDGSNTVVDGLATPREPVGTIVSVAPLTDPNGVTVLAATVRTSDNKTLTGVEILDHVSTPAPGDSVVVLAGYIIGRRRVPTTSEES